MDEENELILQAQANDADLETPLEELSWWIPDLPWMFQDQQKLREWHEAQWVSLRRWK